MSPVMLAAAALTMALVLMLLELLVSRSNERVIRRAGAIEAPDDVYRAMRWAYPGAFVAMAVEGALWNSAPGIATWIGGVVFVVSKAVKVWAIVSLGRRWTYKVLVMPGAPLVETGPYAFVRHPNYAGVLGELIGMALIVGARVSGPLGTLYFALLLQRRIEAEERALGLRSRVPAP